MIRRPPRSTRTDTLFPYTTLFRSDKHGYAAQYASGYFEEFKRILETKGGGYFPDVIKDDPPAHTRVRRLMDKAFTAHRVASLEPRITEIIVGFIEKLADKAANGEVEIGRASGRERVCQDV